MTQNNSHNHETAAATNRVLSPAAITALANFLGSLNQRDTQVLTALLARFRSLFERQRAVSAAAEEEACLSEMEKEPAFQGIRGRREAMHGLIARVPWLRNLPTRDRLAAACYIDRGMQQHAPTPEEKLEAVLSDPALLRALAQKQAALRAALANGTPPVRNGGRAPAVIKETPKSLSEAKTEAKRFLRAK